jgi:hypothetical protein
MFGSLFDWSYSCFAIHQQSSPSPYKSHWNYPILHCVYNHLVIFWVSIYCNVHMVMNTLKHLTPYVMSLHTLQRKLVFMWFKNNCTFCLLCLKHLDLSHWHCPFEGWGLKLLKHCHYWSHVCKYLAHTSFAFSFATCEVAQT